MGILDAPGSPRVFTAPPAGVIGTKRFHTASGWYNLERKHLRRARAALGKARNGSGVFKVAGLGDSTMAGTGAGTPPGHFAGNTTYQVADMLGGRGYPLAGGVTVGYQESAKSELWTTYDTTKWTDFGRVSSLIQANTAGVPLVFTSNRAGTIVNVYYGNSGSPFTVAIDGGAAVTVTPAGGDTFGTYTVTGLANTTHTVTITRTGASNSHVMGVEVLNTATSGVRWANLGIGGQKSADLTGNHWFNNRRFAAYWGSNLTMLLLSINDAGQGVSVATQKANLTTIINAIKADGADVLLMTAYPSDPAVVASATQQAFVQGHYDLADTLDVPLLDITARWDTYDVNKNTLGLMGDQLHPKAAGYADVAQAVVAALANV